MELAEACLRTSGELIGALRAARTPGFKLGKREPGDSEGTTAVRKIIQERLKTALEAWSNFTQQYSLAPFYFDNAPQPSPADQLTGVLLELSVTAEMMFTYEQGEDLGGRLTEPLRTVRKEFYFHEGAEPDDIERTIRAADTQLRDFFGPILRSGTTWSCRLW